MSSAQQPSAAPAAPVGTGGQANGRPAPNPHRKRAFFIFLGSVLLFLIAGTVYYFAYYRLYESTDDAFVEGHVVLVAPRVAGQVVELRVTDNQHVNQGDVLVVIDPRDFAVRVDQATAALSSAQARAEAAKTNVSLTTTTARADFDVATQGVEIARSAERSAQAQLSAAQSRLEQTKAAINTAQAVREQAVADVAAAGADKMLADENLDRTKSLREKGTATQQELDIAVAAAKTGIAHLESARKRQASTEAMLAEATAAQQTAVEGVRQAEAQAAQAKSTVAEAQARREQVNVTTQRIDVAQAQRDQAQADADAAAHNLAQAKLMLGYATITAPQSGRITRRTVESGAYVNVGQALLAIVPDEIWIVANFKETQLDHMRPGQKVTVEVDAFGSLELAGHVDSIQRGTGARFSLLPPENATGNYVKVVQRVPVKIVLDSVPADVQLSPGMSVVPKVRVR